MKGKSQPVAIHEILEYHTKETFPNVNEALGHFKHGVECYQGRRWDAAIAAFNDVLRLNPKDKASSVYVARCRHLIEQPPPEDWDGVWHMESK